MSKTSDFLGCVSLFMCLGVLKREIVRACLMGAVETHYPFLFALSVFVLPQGPLYWGLFAGFRQQSERRQQSGGFLVYLILQWREWAGFGVGFPPFPPCSRLIQISNCVRMGTVDWWKNNVQPVQLGGGCLQPTCCTVLYFLGSIAQIPQRENNYPGSVFVFTQGLLNPCFSQSGCPLFQSTKTHVLPVSSFWN